jgi:hypothetical protein
MAMSRARRSEAVSRVSRGTDPGGPFPAKLERYPAEQHHADEEVQG